MIRRRHDDRELPLFGGLAHALKHFDAGEAWHHYVEQDEVVRCRRDARECIGAIDGEVDGHAMTPQPPGEAFAVGLVVIDDEDEGVLGVIVGHGETFRVSIRGMQNRRKRSR